MGPQKSPTNASKSSRAASSSADHVHEGSDRQEFLAATVQYDYDRSKPTQAERKVLEHVLATYSIPEDFELNKSRYGPLSGTNYNQRLLTNYAMGTLPLKRGAVRTLHCAECGGTGHLRTDCPQGF